MNFLARSGRLLTASLAVALLLSASGCQKVSARLVANEGNQLYKAEKYEAAIEKYREALEKDPSLTRLYRSIGFCYMALFHPASPAEKDKIYADEAISAFKKFIEANPKDPEGPTQLERMYLAANRYDEAIAAFTAKLDKNPNDLDSIQRLALIYRKKGDVENALKYSMRQADLTVDPEKRAEALYTIGAIAWDRSFNYPNLDPEERDRLLEQGLKAVMQAISLRKDYVEALTYANLLYREKAKYQEDPEKAKEFIQMADDYRGQAIALIKAAREAKKQAAAAAKGEPAGASTPTAPEAATPEALPNPEAAPDATPSPDAAPDALPAPAGTDAAPEAAPAPEKPQTP